jgi:hypothetical protein
MKLVCLAAAPRTGSNLLTETWAAFDRHLCFNEVFHTHGVLEAEVHLQDLSRHLGQGFRSVQDPALIAEARGAPLAFLDVLARIATDQGAESLSFKLFPPHLTEDHLPAVLGRPDLSVVILKRRPIEAHVSDLKATALRRWTEVDTSGMTVALNLDVYLAWKRRRDAWYRRVEAILSALGKPAPLLTYARDIDTDADSRLALSQALFRGFGLSGALRAHRPAPRLFKQDRSGTLADKVSNWDEVLTLAETRGVLDEVLAEA